VGLLQYVRVTRQLFAGACLATALAWAITQATKMYHHQLAAAVAAPSVCIVVLELFACSTA
jgi:hypothetical protein